MRKINIGVSRNILHINRHGIESIQRLSRRRISNINSNDISSSTTSISVENNSSEEYLNLISNLCNEYLPAKVRPFSSERARFHTPSDTSDTDWIYAPSPEDTLFGKVLPIHTAQDCIDLLHDYMPYYGAIILIPFVTKMVSIMPLQIIAQKRQEKIMPHLPKAMQEYRAAAAKYKTDKTKLKLVNDLLKKKYGFNPVTAPLRPMVALFLQMPIHTTFFIASRTMYSSYPDVKFGGALWFNNLAIPDPTWMLPVCASLCTGLSLIVGQRIQMKNPHYTSPFGIPPEFLRIGMGVMCLFMIPIAHQFNAGFNIYMAANVISFMFQTMTLQNDKFRSIVGLKPVSFQNQYQKETQQINQAFSARAKQDTAQANVTYEPIQTRSERRTRTRKR